MNHLQFFKKNDGDNDDPLIFCMNLFCALPCAIIVCVWMRVTKRGGSGPNGRACVRDFLLRETLVLDCQYTLLFHAAASSHRNASSTYERSSVEPRDGPGRGRKGGGGESSGNQTLSVFWHPPSCVVVCLFCQKWGYFWEYYIFVLYPLLVIDDLSLGAVFFPLHCMRKKGGVQPSKTIFYQSLE